MSLSFIRPPFPEWMEDAICTQSDPEVFFPRMGAAREVDERNAKTICESCAVKTKCLDYALENGEPFGIWGGVTAHERAKMRRQAS